MPKKIINPIFIDLSEQTSDTYWQHIFENCAYGKFPKGKGVGYKNGELKVKKGNDTTTIVLPDDNIDKCFKLVLNIFQNIAGMKSKKDESQRIKNIQDKIDDISDSNIDTWNKIKKKKIREKILLLYTINLKNKLKLSDDETASLYTLLTQNIQNNVINNEDIHMNDGHITYICNLKYDPTRRYFYCTETTGTVKNKKENTNDKSNKTINLEELWSSYIKKLPK